MKKWTAALAASVILGAAIVFFLLNSTDSENRLTEAEAMEKVTALYGGTADGSTVSGDGIIVEFHTGDGKYTAFVDRGSGQVSSVELIEKTGPAKTLDEKQAEEIALSEVEGKIEETKYVKDQNEYEVTVAGKNENTTLAISAENGEIRKISTEEIAEADPPQEEEPAAGSSGGIITRDEAVSIARKTLDGEVQEVEFEETQDGGYYLVEIENDETDQEATIQIHAIRGETLTVDWDD